MNEKSDNKSRWRRAMCTLKRDQTEQERDKRSEQICYRLLQHPLCKEARRILLYHALPDEVQTQPLLSVWSAEKELFLPQVNGCDLQVIPYSEAALQQGAFGIWEPVGNPITDLSVIDIIIVPGVAFDRCGHRLGRGKGFYDRLLSQIKSGVRIGICFDWQLQETLPADIHDIGMHYVLSETEIIHIL